MFLSSVVNSSVSSDGVTAELAESSTFAACETSASAAIY
jgi:hypothetical protein